MKLNPTASLLEAGLTTSKFVSPDTAVSTQSVFSNALWKMSSLVSTPGISESDKTWDFRDVPGYPYGFSLAMAEYAYARLYNAVATHDRESEWLTLHNELYILKSFSKYCASQGRQGFYEVDNNLLERYLDYTMYVECKTDDRIYNIFRIIYRLWEYSSRITMPLTNMPFDRPLNKMFTHKKDRVDTENRTPPIPEPIYTAIMRAALDYVLEYSHVILDTWEQLHILWHSEIAHLHLSESMKTKRFTIVAKKLMKDVNSGWLKKPIQTYGDLYVELQQLRTACTLTILAYSGIRTTELLSLTAGCYIKDFSVDGQSIYYINTILHKHTGNGRKDTWVVIEEVVNAIKIIEALTRKIRDAANDQRLMLTDGSNNSFSVNKNFTGRTFTEFTMTSIVYQLNSFRDHCNINLDRAPIPEWPNEFGVSEPWAFNARQFRRTLARFIARQPFGVIAGMLQYKHVEVAIFQGYAGEEPEWNKLLKQEKVLANVDILGELAMDLSQGMVAGEFGTHLKSQFNAEFRGRAEDYPPSQIAKWLANTNKALFVGKFNFCFFDPTKAICTSRNPSIEKPIINFCQPGNCNNACISKRHKPLWEAQLNQAYEFYRHPKTSVFQKHQLQVEILSLESVVQELKEAE